MYLFLFFYIKLIITNICEIYKFIGIKRMRRDIIIDRRIRECEKWMYERLLVVLEVG